MLDRDFWTRAIGFTTTTAGQLNKAHVQFLGLVATLLFL